MTFPELNITNDIESSVAAESEHPSIDELQARILTLREAPYKNYKQTIRNKKEILHYQRMIDEIQSNVLILD